MQSVAWCWCMVQLDDWCLVLGAWCLVRIGAWCLVRLGAGVGEGIRGSDGELGPRVHQQIVLRPRGMFDR